MENVFEKYYMYNRVDGKIVSVNEEGYKLSNESFELFKSLFCHAYGAIYEDENLVSIHTGGWSDNESLIYEFKQTWWWNNNHKITANGGHYYFNTDFYADKEWKIVAS